MKKYDFIVIGAGVSGLTSAILLAKSGYSVAIVEESDQLSPLLRGFTRKGVHFDTGFHYTGGLGIGEPLDIIFRYLGLSENLTSFPFQEQGFDIFRSIKDELEFHFPTGYGPIRENLVDRFPDERKAIDKYLQKIRSICNSMPYLNLDLDLGNRDSFNRLDDTTLQETLDALTDNKFLKALLSMHSVLYGVPPSEVRFTQHACIVGNYYQSARGIRGGGLSLAKAFEKRVEDLGIAVFCGSNVDRISLSTQGAVSGVTLDNKTELACSGCMATINPGFLLDMLPDDTFRPSYVKRLRGLKETVSAYMLYAVSDEPIPLLAGSNLFVFPDVGSMNILGSRTPEENMLYLTAAYRGAESDPMGFVGISPVLFEQTAAWRDSKTGKRPDDYRVFKADIVSRLKRHIDSSCPELKGTMQYIEGSTPLTVRDFNNTPNGGLYGIKHMSGQHNPYPLTRVKGLFLAGQAIVSPGIMGAVLSAFVACENILGHDRLRKELKACS